MKVKGSSLLLAGVSALALTAFAATADAALVNGKAWFTTNANAGSATPTTIGTLGSPSFTFTASQAQFSSFGNHNNTGNGSLDYTAGSWLASLGSLLTSTATPGQNSTVLSNGSTTGTMFEFTGTAHFTHGQKFTVVHDDGVDMFVNGASVLSSPGPHSPITQTFTYTGSTGSFGFNFVYGECCGAPAVFETTLVPEPGSLALLGTGLLLLGAGAGWRPWRRRS